MCGVVFTDRDTKETISTHLLVNWASATADFYSRRSSGSDLTEGKAVFPLQLFQNVEATMGNENKLEYGNVGGRRRSTGEKRSPDEGGVLSDRDSSGSGGFDGKKFVQGVDVSMGTMQFGALWNDPPPFNVSWGSVSCSSPGTGPTHNGTGTYVYRLSPMGDLSAVVVNQKRARETRIIFFSPLNQVGVSVNVYPPQDESKTGR